MNREILFRGKRVDTGEWAYGDLAYDRHGATLEVKRAFIHIALGPVQTNAHNAYGSVGVVEVDPKTVGQRIARVFVRGDVADLPIYCGDIIEFQYGSRYTVGLVEVEFGVPIIVSRCLADGFIYLSEVLKVDENQAVFEGCRLGNIHDNPELLEVLGDG